MRISLLIITFFICFSINNSLATGYGLLFRYDFDNSFTNQHGLKDLKLLMGSPYEQGYFYPLYLNPDNNKNIHAFATKSNLEIFLGVEMNSIQIVDILKKDSIFWKMAYLKTGRSSFAVKNDNWTCLRASEIFMPNLLKMGSDPIKAC